jgi:NAD(P)-dependent dehydrogenase (short-subunit alcohol dehydrogenase family)
MSNAKKLEGKVALVTGGTTGIGLAAAQDFAAQGAVVYITGRRPAELDAAVSTITAAGASAYGIQGDVSKLEDLDRIYAEIQQRSGHLNILFANAGGGDMMPLDAITEEHFDRIFDTNVKGTLFTVQKALHLLEDGSSIILTASTVSVKGTENFSVYSASKAAVRNFARNWLLDLKPRKIRVNAISPGPIHTPGLAGLVPEEHQSGLLGHLATLVPVGRLGEPSEVAKAVTFLASDDSTFINGIELFVDGGQAQI